jgi:predicted TIM-barrel fold metal-dependent hydrolase
MFPTIEKVTPGRVPMRFRLALSLAAAITAFPLQTANSQDSPPLDGREGRDLSLSNFRPRAMLKVPATNLPHAKFPVVDVHTHFRVRTRGSIEFLDNFVKVMDRNQIRLCVSLDGGLGDQFAEHKKYLAKYENRFLIFANIDWLGDGKADDPATWDCHRPDFGRRMALALADAKKQGASGLKIFKSFGLELKNPDGSLVKIDDPRWDPIWAACGELGLPVLIHVADPIAFFLPIDASNERWEELHRHPEWSFYGPKFPRHDELLDAFLRVVGRHPKTNFIGAHVASNAEDLATVAALLDKHPNLYVEFASRISELGRQPYSTRQFLIKYSDRVLFGTDGPWPEERLRLYWRFLETFDENFPYSEKDPPPQGLWNIHGVGLPDDVLQKIYSANAARLIPGVRDKLKSAP